jgi:ABC-type transporter Mla MlaB component
MTAADEVPALSAGSPRSSGGPRTIVLVIGAPLTRADVPALCERVHELLRRSDIDWVTCEVGALTDPDLVTIEALALMQLTARRLGGQVRLRHACGKLQGLLALTGLRDVVPLCAELGPEPGRQTEQREQPRGVEERVEPDDSSS